MENARYSDGVYDKEGIVSTLTRSDANSEYLRTTVVLKIRQPE